MVWRPVLEGLGSLVEVTEQWTIEDLFDAHEALDIRNESQRYYAERKR
jgi:hypothetical protein